MTVLLFLAPVGALGIIDVLFFNGQIGVILSQMLFR